MDSYWKASGGFSSSLVESSLTIESPGDRVAGHCGKASLGAAQDEGCLSSENFKGNEIRACAVDGEIMGERIREALTGILDIYVHHARDIHNICIYDKQDVYAKLSLTCNPEEALSTRIVNGGGRNPVFNESLQLKISNQVDAVLKCEVWMLSRARNYLEDQLLGFTLVPLSTVVGREKLTQDFTLSSTDLFHSPAGIVQLTLSYNGSLPPDYHRQSIADTNLARSESSISSEVVLLPRGVEDSEPTDYNDIEFPDLQVANENRQMVSEYFKMASNHTENSTKLDLMAADPNGNGFSGASFLHLGASPLSEDDYDMLNTTDEEGSNASTALTKDSHLPAYQNHPGAENSSYNVISSTATSSSEDQSPHDFVAEKNASSGNSGGSQEADNHPDTSTLVTINGSAGKEEKLSPKDSVKEGPNSSSEAKAADKGVSDTAFNTPLLSVNLEPEQSVMQQQIVDMYMKSMQQFTESLAKMKLPMDVENQESDDAPKTGSAQKNVEPGRKSGSRVFYGSRAFF